MTATRFGFASSYRALFQNGDASGARAQVLAVAAVSALFAIANSFLPILGFNPAYFVIPAGVSVALGAAMFGIGMQLSNACGSGSLVATGTGSIRMLIVIPAFIAGSFWATLDSSFWNALPAFPATMLGDTIGWPPALFLYALVLMAVWKLLPAGNRIPGRLIVGALVLAILNFLTLVAAGHPWGITWGFALAGAKIAQGLGWTPDQSPYWQEDWAKAALDGSLLGDTTVLMDIGVVAGAFAASMMAGTFGRHERPPPMQLVAAAVGGLLMGYGARISGGCNVGAFFSGVASFSPHGWLWIAMALAGVWAGLRLRPAFGFRDA